MDINDKIVKRLNLLHRSIDSSYQRLKDVLYNDNEDEAFLALKALLDLIFSLDEIHFEKQGYFNRRDNDEKGNLLNGLRFVANQMKHGRICFEVHEITTIPKLSFPLKIPEEGMVFGEIQAVWIRIETLPNPKLDNNDNFKKQREVYNEYFVDKEIFKTIDAGIDFLLKEKKNYDI